MKARNLCRNLALVGLIAFANGALAQARPGFYALGALGYLDHSVDQNTFNATYALGAPPDVATFSQSNEAYKIGVGYRFGRHFAVEGAYARLGKATYNLARPAPFAGNFRFAAKPEAWQLAALGIFPLSNSFELFGKLGVAFTENDGDISNTGAPFPPVGAPGNTSSDTVAVLGVGLNFNWGPNLFLRGEYESYSKYKLANVPDLRPAFGPLAQPGGDIKNRTSLWSIGLGYRF
jgi:opacity protein-like surface antigen